MPIAVWVLVRIVRAFGETAVLLSDRKTLRALPWPYIRAAPRRSKLGGVAVASLALSAACLLLGIVVKAALAVGIVVAFVGLFTSWVAKHRLRHV
jgi:hypothetical protein